MSAESLHDITDQGAIAEGIEREWDGSHYWYPDYNRPNIFTKNPIASYLSLWSKINGQESTDKNPWVFVYKFDKIEKP